MDKLKSAEIFELMSEYLKRGEGEKAVKKCNAVYNIDILDKKGGKVQGSWVIDLLNGKGMVTKGKDNKASATFVMDDENFFKMCMGKVNPQIAFVRGIMKIKGSVAKATKFTPELFPKPTKENMEKYLPKPKL